ncbi:MAG: M3 family oligoendopeptidase [Phenylobacterium sp.]|uniref:M3 family oligoendopeptidase n=1 Tax=Phenylobacterium sp. TaxID=1871053 RepID=UPI001A516AA4|nr:M3 family oligoendopeptidase [Phenylobacterium sp.]MBL8770823.1 M3 family oligoendopeptidase [Phenylobacterium sp.]
MNAPFKTDALPEWRLDDLYADREDPRIAADLERAEQLNGELARLEGRLIATRSRPAELGGIIDRGIELYEQATNAMWAVGAFASLAASTARNDPAWSKFESDLRARTSQIAAMSLFFTLEINRLEDDELEMALKANKSAQRWRPWLRRVRAGRPHELAADLEKLLLDKAPAVANWGRLTDETLARMTGRVDGETLTLNEMLNRMSGPDAGMRKAAAGALARALGARADTLALSLNTLAFEKQVEDRWRKFASPAAGRHLANEVDAEAVDALEAAVVDAYESVSHRYYALKARAMGRPYLDHWDRNCPLDAAPPRTYSWDEAKGIVLESFEALAPRFADTARTFFAQPWIDARPRPGKQMGAYSHSVTAERHPYVFLNYMGERRDVLTLAHELGHAIHQTLCKPLGTLLADTPLTLAETASIFGEGLVFEKLLAEAPKAERRGLLAGKIEDGINTVVRQIAFHRFETRFHAARQQGELSADEIGSLWTQVMSESLGPAVRLDKGYRHYWAYISHFVHAPFYVYAYAFGDLLVRALMEKRREDPKAFAPVYEKLLAAGGTKTYVQALAPFGLDPRTKSFWAAGTKQLERLVDEFEALV